MTPASAPATTDRDLLPLDEIAARIEKVLEHSPADETEVVWLESRHGGAFRRGQRVEARTTPSRTVLVRVLDLGRVGSFRTGAGGVSELCDGVRMAMAQSRAREPLAGLPHLPADDTPVSVAENLFDPAVAALDLKAAKELLRELPARRETLALQWAEARVAVFNSRKLRRRAEVTAVAFETRCGRRPGSGRAADAARRLDDLDLAAVVERAQGRHGQGEPAEVPAGPITLVLAPEAVIELVDLLNQVSFVAKAYYDGTSFLREHLGVQVFDRALNLVDDATDPSGIPFPFDLEGTAKRRVPLIQEGAPKTPTLDQRQAAVLGLPPTAHAIGGNNARAENLFLLPGDRGEEELLAGGGVWVGWLDHLECHEPRRVQFRTRCRGARLIENGALGRPLPDLFWSDSLLRALSGLRGLGHRRSRRLSPDGFLGGISAPTLALTGVHPDL